MKRLIVSTLVVLGALATITSAQITIPYTFTPNTDILSSEVNSNFTTLGNDSLDRTGGTVTGAIDSSGGSLTGSWAGTFSLTGAAQFDADAVRIADTNASHYLIVTPGSDLTANRVLTLVTGDAARTLTLSADVTLSGDPYNASNLSSGTVPTARLGSGTANATTFLRGDQTYASISNVVGATTATVDANNTVDETSVFSATVTGGTLGTSNALHLTMLAQLENDSTATRTTTIRVKYGATTIFVGDLVIASTFTSRSPVLIDVWLYAQGATNAQTASMDVRLGANSGGVDGGDIVSNVGSRLGFARNVAVDSTSNQTFEVTVANSDADYLFRVDSARLIKVQ